MRGLSGGISERRKGVRERKEAEFDFVQNLKYYKMSLYFSVSYYLF
jgi:hypothetical protein